LKVLEKQRLEQKIAHSMYESLESLHRKIAETEIQIADARRESDEKEERIRQLKTEISRIQDEVEHEELLALTEEARARDYAAELDKIDDEIKLKRIRVEKLTNQVEALQMHLAEMQKFRAILQAELNDLHNRQNPEVRQLMIDVQTSREKVLRASEQVTRMVSEVEMKKQALEQLVNSDEVRRYQELRTQRVNLERRLRKWTALLKESTEIFREFETFSIAHAAKRRVAADALKSKEKVIMKKRAEVDELEQYAELLESMIREHKRNWM
jgi:chromosome segregation ATPase